MRKLKTDVAIVGDGCAAMLAVSRLINLGYQVILINPCEEFGIGDIRPHSGLSLWGAAYRMEESTSLTILYDRIVQRFRETFPATLEHSGLKKTDYWSILSSTPVHRSVTEELEKEFFKLERKTWSSGQFRLVNPEHVFARTRRLGVELSRVAQVEGAVVRSYGLWWDAPKIGYFLSQFIKHKFSEDSGQPSFLNAKIEKRYGRRLVLSTKEGEEVSVEAQNGLFIFLTGELLPNIKNIVAACDEPWIQGVRKRRREQHFVWFERPYEPRPQEVSTEDEHMWMELGHTRFRWSRAGGVGTWRSGKGPDALERVIDEGLRLQCLPHPTTRFIRAARAFRLEWDWKNPQWRETSHGAYWATSFEGDLWKIMELLWNLPLR